MCEDWLFHNPLRQYASSWSRYGNFGLPSHKLQTKKKGSSLDKIIAFITEAAAKERWISRVILFGSRARGNARDRSDYDIAVVVDDSQNPNWPKWALQMRESAPTLCGLDLVKYDALTSKSLAATIEAEGKIIYERKKF